MTECQICRKKDINWTFERCTSGSLARTAILPEVVPGQEVGGQRFVSEREATMIDSNIRKIPTALAGRRASRCAAVGLGHGTTSDENQRSYA